jgi:hypothetical protein
MAEIILEPYAVQQNWQLAGADPDWKEFLEEYLQQLAQACQAGGRVVNGHIKALALFPAGEYFRISNVGADLPSTSEGTIPPSTRALTLTLNLIVYGLDHEQLQVLTTEISHQMAAAYHGEVSEIPHTHTHVH